MPGSPTSCGSRSHYTEFQFNVILFLLFLPPESALNVPRLILYIRVPITLYVYVKKHGKSSTLRGKLNIFQVSWEYQGSLLTSKFETSKNSNKILFKLLKLEIIDYNYSKLGLGSVCFVHL